MMALMSQLTALKMNAGEEIEDYIIRAYALDNARQAIGEQMLISLVLKRLPESFITIRDFYIIVRQASQTFLS